jgi:hypothetical protein
VIWWLVVALLIVRQQENNGGVTVNSTLDIEDEDILAILEERAKVTQPSPKVSDGRKTVRFLGTDVTVA